MNLMVIFLCFVTAYGRAPEYSSYYRPQARLETRDARGQASDVKSGFVQPLDFSSFTQQFVGEEKSGQHGSFGHLKTSPAFGAESKKSGAFQIPASEFTQFQAPIFSQDENKTGFVQPAQYSSLNKGTSPRVYKTNINPPYNAAESNSKDQIPKATEEEDDEEEDSYFNPSKVQTYRQPKRPKKPYTYGKSSYHSPQSKSSSSDYYSDLVSKPKDVEMILPKEKVLFLPMVNGKPKPYDGYRAAPELSSHYEDDEIKETSEQRERRLNEGEIIYGKPKIALSELHHKHLKRSPAEYYGGIYPYYDYSDAKLSVGGDTDPDAENRKKKSASNQRGKKTYPKKHYQQSREKPYNPYKYPKDNKRRSKEDDTLGYASGESSEEVEEDSEEESEETKEKRPFYKYSYDDTVRVPPLKIKTYPYEKHLRDSEVEGSKRDESVEYDDNVDEYTAGYERYIKTLPSDLETYFGSPDVSDKFSVEATQNLETNKNCKKIEPPSEKTSDETSEKPANESSAETQICYICSDPKTGDSYEQCAYRTQPKVQKYFFGGTTSFQTNETAEPSTYRYKRSAYDYPYQFYPYSLEESESAKDEQYEDPEDSEEIYKKPKRKYKKKYNKQRAEASTLYGKKQPKKSYQEYKEYNPFFKLQGAYSTKRSRAAKVDRPPKSYNGPKYTYEGPEETYEGPAKTYEGPSQPYEGPKETYEGPINQEYYDTVDERIQDEEEEEEESPKQESQSSSPSKSRYYDEEKREKPKKRQSYSSYYDSPYTPSRYYDADYQESYRPHRGYNSDYRFGPEHFVDEGEPEDTKQTEKVKPKPTEKRGPQKFSASEGRSAAATDKQEKEEPIGEVKTFKNGDVCQKKRKEGMICMVCKNEKTAATYEQCQYSTRPKDKYYAYGSQKSYTTKNPEQKQDESESDSEAESEADSDSDQFPEKSDIVEKKILITTQSKVFGYDPIPTEGLAVAESNNSPHILSKDLYGDYTDNIETLPDENNQNDTSSRDFTESIERIEPRDGIEGLEEYLYDAEDSDKKATEEEKQSFRTYDDYFHELFPEFSKSSEPVPESDEKEESESETHLAFDPFSNVRKFHEENNRPERYTREEEEEEDEEEKDAEASRPKALRLKDKESRIPRDFFIPYNEEEHKKDLEKALGEFQNRDWSNCTKIVKKKLTCYQCVDKYGVNNEECMYVEASQPISKHLSYHEKKELEPPSQEIKNKTAEPITEISQPETQQTTKNFHKDKNSPSELVEVVEPPKDAEYVEESTRKGDFEGIEKLPLSQQEQESSEVTPAPTARKPKSKKNKRNPKKRNKTIRNETTTERFEKIRKRKFPIKKFTDSEEIPVEGKPEDGSFGLRSSESVVVKPNQNDTGTSR